jgi:phosphopantothenoylcysteine decarboxylase/phosphopantothenate--cysteine ligase
MASKNLLLGVTGAVGATLVPHYLYVIRQALDVTVYVMMTKAAQRFVTPYTLRLFSGNPVFTDAFDFTDDIRIPHIELARWAHVLLVMPATANIISKAAAGICDELVSTTIVAGKVPTLFAPSMNQAMWEDASVQENLAKLVDRGYEVISPTVGYEISTRVETFGVMPPPEEIVERLHEYMPGCEGGREETAGPPA